ncbi:glycoside hydrolase family 5 protein [Streptomyces sp. NPDC048362]|uniref:glycoside hydrolase family 5 protein n=1 Tax=Streptomyces sp. NPDC048362 TaxID=3365539 RepID=UPI003722C4B0
MRLIFQSRGRRSARTTLVTSVAFALSVPYSCVASAFDGAQPTAVEINGRLRVCATHLCNQRGTPIQLRGMSTHGTQWYAHCLSNGVFDALAYDWNATVLRVSTYARQGGYESNPEKFTQLASKLVGMANARGMYVIVDWHTINPGDPNEDVGKARKFFSTISKKFKNKPNVLYEIANEPHHVKWSTIKKYAESVIPVIRRYSPDSVVLVGTPDWSTLGESAVSAHGPGNEREVVDDQLHLSNIMYTFHFYAARHRERYLATLDRASSRIPVFVSEWGTQSWQGYGNDFAMSQKYVDLMAGKKISWVNWSIADGDHDGDIFKQGVCRGRTFSGTAVLKPAGVWVRERIRG